MKRDLGNWADRLETELHELICRHWRAVPPSSETIRLILSILLTELGHAGAVYVCAETGECPKTFLAGTGSMLFEDLTAAFLRVLRAYAAGRALPDDAWPHHNRTGTA